MEPVSLPNRDVVSTYNALTSLGKFPAGLVQLKVTYLIAALMLPARVVEESHRSLVEEYSLPPGNDGKLRIDPARLKEFREKERALMEKTMEFEVDRLTKQEFDDLPTKREYDPGLLVYLLPFVQPPADGPSQTRSS
jgi:hypothetical protein